MHGVVDHPAHDSADEDRERGGDAEVGAHGEGEGTDAEEFDDDDDGDAEEHERPGKFAGEDAVDDGGHETALRGGGFFAADALDPLDFDLAGGGVVEVLAVFKGGGTDGVEEDVLLCVGEFFFCGVESSCRVAVRVMRSLGEVAVVLDAVGEVVEREGDGFGEALEGFESLVHGVERGPDGEDGDDDADHDGDLLLPGRGADEVAGLEILRGVAGVGGGDADDSADGDGEGSEGGSGPAFDEEDGGGGHQRGDGHAGDGRGGGADDADDARGDGDEEEAEDDDEESGGEVGEHADLRAGDGLELKEEEHQHDEEQ